MTFKINNNPVEKISLRGEVAFERWYFHYAPHSATKELGQVSSRVWAGAYAVESAVKAFIVAISILIYGCMENQPEVGRRFEVLKAQGDSLLHSLSAIISPETARDAFKEKNSIGEIFKRTLSSWGKNYTLYTGTTTVKMLINTH